MAKKYLMDFIISSIRMVAKGYYKLELTPAEGKLLPECIPGQFVDIEVPFSKTTFLRRPISICDIDYERNILVLLIKEAGKGTASLCSMETGERLNILMPLGNGFDIELQHKHSPLLVGGGVGCAPLLYLGRKLKESGVCPRFLLGARKADDLVMLDEFRMLGEVFLTTEDGSAGEKGFVTCHPEIGQNQGIMYVCGPLPMMKAIAKLAKDRGNDCYVSLENKMACGLGACLCCVEDTKKGNKCVCKSGPVFNVESLNW